MRHYHAPSLASANFAEDTDGGGQLAHEGGESGEGGRSETASSGSCAFEEHECQAESFSDAGEEEGEECLEYAEPSEEEIHERVAALFNAKSGVLRDREGEGPFDAAEAVWAPCFVL